MSWVIVVVVVVACLHSMLIVLKWLPHNREVGCVLHLSSAEVKNE
jgi:hypothetical protein